MLLCLNTVHKFYFFQLDLQFAQCCMLRKKNYEFTLNNELACFYFLQKISYTFAQSI